MKGIAIPLVLFAAACSGLEKEAGTTVSFALYDEAGTRSSYVSGADYSVDKVLFAVYDKDGRLEYSTTSGQSFSYEFRKGEDYDIVALVNSSLAPGKIPATFGDGTAFREKLPASRLSPEIVSAKGLPMAGKIHIKESDLVAGSTVRIPIVRKFARLDIRVDFSSFYESLNGISRLDCETRLGEMISAVRISAGGVNGRISHFAPSSAKSGGDIMKTSTDSDSRRLTGTMLDLSIYVPENMKGTLLPGNGSPSGKTAAALGKEADLCTYVEIDFSMAREIMGVGGDLKYRFYPGADAVSNFDIEGGKAYPITLVPSFDNALDLEVEWKLDNSGWDDTRSLCFSQSRYFAPKGKVFRFSGKLDYEGRGSSPAFAGKDIFYSIRPASGEAWTDIESGLSAGTEIIPGVRFISASGCDEEGYEGLNLQFSSALGTKYKLRMNSRDGRHSASCDVTVITDEELGLSWNREPAVVAMKGSLSVSNLEPALNESLESFTVLEGKEHVRYSSSGKALSVSAISPGEVKILAKTSIFGEPGRSRIITLPISAPALHTTAASTDGRITLNPDGTSINLEPFYTIPGSSARYTSYDASLFAELLRPSVSVSGPWLGSSGTSSVNIAHINHSPEGSTIVEYLPLLSSSPVGAVTISPASSSCGVQPLSIQAHTFDIFADLRGNRSFGVYHDRSLVLPYRLRDKLNEPLKTEADFPVNAIFNGNRSLLSFFSDCLFTNGGYNNSVVITGTFSPRSSGGARLTKIAFEFIDGKDVKHLAGMHTLYARLTRGGETLTAKMGTFEVYTHIAVGGRMVSEGPMELVSVQMSNYDHIRGVFSSIVEFDDLKFRFNTGAIFNNPSPVPSGDMSDGYVNWGVFGLETMFYIPPRSIPYHRGDYMCPLLICTSDGKHTIPYGSVLHYVYPEGNHDRNDDGYYCLGYLFDYCKQSMGWIDYFDYYGL
ncbi:hypothetical protein SAMN06298215_0945 [Bacteroidales bacterium WCE2008]|nr:hypothetical protein SAMN06298215_0945 [Bacteroidales bacterium WCE2008]